MQPISLVSPPPAGIIKRIRHLTGQSSLKDGFRPPRLNPSVEIERMSNTCWADGVNVEDPVEELIRQLIGRWRAGGVHFNAGASPSEVDEFERLHRVRLSLDLRLFLLTANGMPDNEMDELTHINSLKEYRRIVSRVPRHANVSNAADYFCIGDYNIEGSFYGIRLLDQTNYAAPVRVFWQNGDGWQCAESFQDFVARYVEEGPHSMF